MNTENPFTNNAPRRQMQDGVFSAEEVGLANRNTGMLLEFLSEDITPMGGHYLLNHFDVPVVDAQQHVLQFAGLFERPMKLTMDEIRACPQVTETVTMECAGNGRAGFSPRSRSMPWNYEAVGTANWTGTPLAPLIAAARPSGEVCEISFTGLDRGFDKGVDHAFARSLTLEQIAALDVLLVHEMNGQPLLPQHGAPLRIIVPGWYGMASVKWLSQIEALDKPFDGFQQVGTYRFRTHDDDPGRPIQDIRVKSLMRPPGVPDWLSRKRLIEAGEVALVGRAWSGGGRAIVRVEVGVGEEWADARLAPSQGAFAWRGWSYDWQATPGDHILRCRATDEDGRVQPLEPLWDVSGFANNAAQKVWVHVPE